METVTAQQLLFQLQAIATVDTTELLQVEDGGLLVKDTRELTPSQRAAIASIEKSTGGIKLKLYDKLKALELLCKLLGLGEGGLAPADASLLQAIQSATGEVIDTYDLPEFQQTAEAGHVLVEPAGQ